MKIKFTATWDKQRKGNLLLDYKEKHEKEVDKFFSKLEALQIKKNELKELEVTVEYHYKKRTLDQNALMWSLYAIEANEQNGGVGGHADQVVTSSELYNADLDQHAKRATIFIAKEYFDSVSSSWKVVEKKPIYKKEELYGYQATVMLTTSKMTTVQMAYWIDRIFKRLAYNGVQVADSSEIQNYWQKWRGFLNDNAITLHAEADSHKKYKRVNPICEATGVYLGDTGGHLAHIRSEGAGGADVSENWLHLSLHAHLVIQHQQGWEHFKKLFPHLKDKIEKALGARK